MKNDALEFKFVATIDEISRENGFNPANVADIHLGYDDNIYLLYSSDPMDPKEAEKRFAQGTAARAEYAVLIVHIDWHKACVQYVDWHNLGKKKYYFHTIRPIGEHFLLQGWSTVTRKTHYTEKDKDGNPVKQVRESHDPDNAFVVSKRGEVLTKLNLGRGVKDVRPSIERRILVTYTDEGVFPASPADRPIGRKGFVVWLHNGKKLWQDTEHAIEGCTAETFDDEHHFCYMCYPDGNLIREKFYTNETMETGFEECHFLAVCGDTVITDGGYKHHGNYYSHTIRDGRLTDRSRIALLYQNTELKERYQLFSRGGHILCVLKENILAIGQL